MSDAIQTVLAGFASFLRYIASGFVGLAIFMLTCEENPIELASKHTEFLAVLGNLLGVSINSFHVVLLEDVAAFLMQQFWHLPYLNHRLPLAMRCMCPVERFRAIEEQRLRRRTAEDGPARRFQEQHDAFAATLTFLYCCSYPAFFVASYQPELAPEVPNYALRLGLLFLVAALLGELRFIGLDVWGASAYPQGSLT